MARRRDSARRGSAIARQHVLITVSMAGARAHSPIARFTALCRNVIVDDDPADWRNAGTRRQFGIWASAPAATTVLRLWCTQPSFSSTPSTWPRHCRGLCGRHSATSRLSPGARLSADLRRSAKTHAPSGDPCTSRSTAAFVPFILFYFWRPPLRPRRRARGCAQHALRRHVAHVWRNVITPGSRPATGKKLGPHRWRRFLWRNEI